MFLTSSIEKLVDLQKIGYDEGNNRVQFINLIRKFPNTFKCLQSVFPKVTFAMMKLMTQKGVYPYSFVDSEEKYALTGFPPIEAFYDDLNKMCLKHFAKWKLPYKDFKWRPDLITADIVRMIHEYNNGDKGYILEVDLLYPEALHNLHDDYPLAPEHMIIDKCSKTSHSMLKSNIIKPIKCDKLVGTLSQKELCCAHSQSSILFGSWFSP
eukprot:TRINITY_DN203_c1_g1_i9.p1 TRINITY_DN203_c1_g1~~TRINITY_DN203_c1_g1_i9.p1  ORF type:complete len:210 (-),score=23.94 TRINITY_DN203_c1_g1_i9:474-1103(-)